MAGVIILIIAAAVAPFLWYRSVAATPINLSGEETTIFQVESGQTLIDVAGALEREEIIDKASNLLWLNRIQGLGAIQAATYQFEAGMSLQDLYEAVVYGTHLSPEKQATLIEGYTLEQIAQVLFGKTIIASDDAFVVAASTGIDRFQEAYPILEDIPDGQGLEGYLFPDTYRFFDDSTIDEIILRMLANFDDKLDNQMRQAIVDSGRTVHDVLTLASIVEREVRSPDEMRTVAGIFQNRLDIGMALQADSTVNFITKSGRARSTTEDLEIDSLYNTYRYPGLPPGPISNPGLNALQAAIFPEETDYLYFLTDEAGKVYYAETFEEHQSNRQYL